MPAEKEPKPQSYFVRLLDELKARGLPVPEALVGEPRPLSLSTRQDLPAWAQLYDYDLEALLMLNKLVKAHIRSKPYLEALASDLSMRYDLDGAVAEPVSESDRHSAALMLHTRELRDAAKRAPGSPQPAANGSAPTPPPSSTPSPSTPSTPAAQGRSTVRLGRLSAEEVDRRRAALAGAGK